VPACFTGSASRDDRREPLVLFVGSVFNRRRVPDLIAAFRIVLDRCPAPGWRSSARTGRTLTRTSRRFAGRPARATASAFRSYVADPELAEAYRRASAFAFLSEYEGFGLPPLEALACGIPPVLLDTPVAREVCGPAARYVPPDVPAIAAALANSSATRAPVRPCCARPAASCRATRGPRPRAGRWTHSNRRAGSRMRAT